MIASIDVWAVPLNSALLIILATTNYYIAHHQRKELDDVGDLKRSLGLTKRHSDDPEVNNSADTGERRRATDRRHP